MDSNVPPDPATAGWFPNGSDTNEDDEDEPVTAAAVVDEEKEEEDEGAGIEDPSITDNRTKSLTKKRDLERRGRRRLPEKAALNKGARMVGRNHVLPPPHPQSTPNLRSPPPPPCMNPGSGPPDGRISAVGPEDGGQGMRATRERTAAQRAWRGARLGIRGGLSETGVAC